MPLKISISGVRGTLPDALTPEVCLDFAKAFGTYLGGGKVVVGTDTRQSSEFIKGIVFQGLLSTGCRVIDIGIAPTPTVGIMTRELKAAGGIVITASHNPLPWNGIKFMRSDGIFLNEAQAKKLIKHFEEKDFCTAPAVGVSFNRSAIDIHIRKVLKIINPLAIRRKKFRVAVDACNGAGSIALVSLLKKLGCRVFPLHCNIHLPFPHPPEPIAENLGDLTRLVSIRKADLGLALDSDADRLALVSEEGKVVGEELTLALAVDYLLKKNVRLSQKKKIIVTNLSTTKTINELCRQYGATLIRTKIGEVHVSEELKHLKGLIGGEGNGGVIFPRVGYNRDTLVAAALILNHLASSGKTLSALAGALPQFEMVKTKIECASLDEANDHIDIVKAIFKGEDMILTDGVKILLPDAWLHVRASNTEPIVRIIAEAKTRAQAEELIKRAAP